MRYTGAWTRHEEGGLRRERTVLRHNADHDETQGREDETLGRLVQTLISRSEDVIAASWHLILPPLRLILLASRCRSPLFCLNLSG